MKPRKRSDRWSRRPRRLSYANVMSTLGVFIALGGTGYAVTRINGSQIVNRSISREKLRLGAVSSREISPTAVVPHAALADRAADLLVPASRHRSVRRASTAQAGQPCATGSLVQLTVGQSCIMFTKAPFSITAACNDAGGGNVEAVLTATSTEDHWWANDTFYPAGTETLWTGSSALGNPGTKSFSVLADVSDLLAPDGTALQFPRAGVFFHEFGDCAFVMDGMG